MKLRSQCSEQWVGRDSEKDWNRAAYSWCEIVELLRRNELKGKASSWLKKIKTGGVSRISTEGEASGHQCGNHPPELLET